MVTSDTSPTSIRTSLYAFKRDVSIEALAAIIGLAAILGITFEDSYVDHSDDSMHKAFVPNDTINLLFGIPMLLVSSNKKLLLPGALAYHLYSSLTYVLALRHNPNSIFFLHLAVLYIALEELWSSCYDALTMVRAADSTRAGASMSQLRWSGVVLMFWGSLFFLRAGVGLCFTEMGIRDETESAIHVADLAIGPCWLLGGWRLYHRPHCPSQLVLGLSLLYQASTLFIGLILLLLIRPWILEDNKLEREDILVVSLMSLTVILPFVLVNSRTNHILEKPNYKRRSSDEESVGLAKSITM